jgi:CheY-like chemotaxis protein
MQQGKPTIVLAEDDDGHAALLERNLRRAGVQNPLVRLHDGQQVLDFFSGCGPAPHGEPSDTALLLLDISMPRVDGFSVLEHLRQDSRLAELPVIMITSSDDPKEAHRCADLGGQGCLRKPVACRDLARVVNQLGLTLCCPEDPSLDD